MNLIKSDFKKYILVGIIGFEIHFEEHNELKNAQRRLKDIYNYHVESIYGEDKELIIHDTRMSDLVLDDNYIYIGRTDWGKIELYINCVSFDD